MKANMNKIITGVAAIFAGFSLTGCQDNFEKYNTNQYEVTTEQTNRDDLLLRSYFAQLQRSVFVFRDGTYLDSDYQIMYNLASETWCGYMAPTLGANGGVNTGSFYIIDGWTRSLFVNKYTYTMSAWTEMSKKAVDQNRPQIKAVGDILKVLSMQQVADSYGSIPYSEVGTTVTPKYDNLQNVYHQFIDELDNAITVLTDYYTANEGLKIMPDDDYLYGGDVHKWVKLANSLRLRVAMRMVYAEPEFAKEQAEKAVSHTGGVIEDVADIAVLPNSLVQHHPLYEINVNFNNGDTQMNADMDCYLNGYNDPRTFMIAKKADNDGKFHGVRNGIHTTDWSPYWNKTGLVSAPNADPSVNKYKIVFMAPSEVWLLRAEGALRGWSMGNTAKECYEKGVSASFEEWGAGSATTYLADNTSKPAAFVDITGKGNDAAAPSTITISYDESADFETNLERIITQKWIALFPNGPEAWSEYRRTRYPKLLPAVNNDSQGAVNSDLQIRRVPYPISEYTDNPDGVASGVSSLGGPDNAGTKVWWDKKN